jgi:lactoylglutathione lyase
VSSVECGEDELVGSRSRTAVRAAGVGVGRPSRRAGLDVTAVDAHGRRAEKASGHGLLRRCDLADDELSGSVVGGEQALEARPELGVAGTVGDVQEFDGQGGSIVQDLREVTARLVGINHVALEVGDLDEALAWYGRFFGFEVDLSEREIGMAFLQMGDQFLALAEVAGGTPDHERHFGLVVDVDKATVRRALEEAGVEVTAAPNLTFRDPWGNAVQVVDYRDIQFTKAPFVLRGMGLGGLEKTDAALRELADMGLAAD